MRQRWAKELSFYFLYSHMIIVMSNYTSLTVKFLLINPTAQAVNLTQVKVLLSQSKQPTRVCVRVGCCFLRELGSWFKAFVILVPF